jgi:hypothetical protein
LFPIDRRRYARICIGFGDLCENDQKHQLKWTNRDTLVPRKAKRLPSFRICLCPGSMEQMHCPCPTVQRICPNCNGYFIPMIGYPRVIRSWSVWYGYEYLWLRT